MQIENLRVEVSLDAHGRDVRRWTFPDGFARQWIQTRSIADGVEVSLRDPDGRKVDAHLGDLVIVPGGHRAVVERMIRAMAVRYLAAYEVEVHETECDLLLLDNDWRLTEREGRMAWVIHRGDLAAYVSGMAGELPRHPDEPVHVVLTGPAKSSVKAVANSVRTALITLHEGVVAAAMQPHKAVDLGELDRAVVLH